MLKQVEIRHQIFLLLATLIVVFMPALFSEPIAGDDSDLFASLASLTNWDLQSLLPSGRIYCRPVTILSYRFDKLIWQLNPLAMHLENLLLHAANALLVLFLARAFLPDVERNSSLLPFSAALLFGLHPLTAESVNWISGRTDPMACFFILISTLAIMDYRKHGRLFSLCLAGFFFILGMLSKEVAVAFLPGALCLVFARDYRQGARYEQRCEQNKADRLWSSAWLGAALTGFMFFYFMAWNSRPGKLALTVRIIFSDLWYAFFVCMRAFAFYIRKIVWPFPLNFAILEVDPLYELLAFPLLIGCFYLLWRRNLIGALLLTGVFLIVPSFLLAFNQIAWTPYAERYLYLPCAFIVPCLLLIIRRTIPWQYMKLCSILLFIVLLGAGSATYARTLTWRSNLELWADTVKKSPWSAEAKNGYGIALVQAGRLIEAKVEFEGASNLTGISYQPLHGLNYALLLVELKDLEGARLAYETVLKRTNGLSTPAREGLIGVIEKLVAQNEGSARLTALQAELSVLKGLNR